MKLTVDELRSAVNSIQITEKMQEEIIQNINAQSAEKRKKRKTPHTAYIAAAAAAVVVISAVLSIPVRAFVSSLIQERMESEPPEEMEAIVADLDSQQVGGDSFSREYTEKEQQRLYELTVQYQAGTFPQGELFQAYSIEEAAGRELFFLAADSTFYLPERELTDEELLEIIDFYAKREYALTKYAEEERAEEIAARKEQEKQQIEEVVEAGGITEEEAVRIATGYLEQFFGINGEGLERNQYYDEERTIADENRFYCVNWTDFPARKHYYFYISARDGSLVEVNYSGKDISQAEGPAVGEIDKLSPDIQTKAVAFMEEKMQFAYEDVYSVYYTADDALCRCLSFLFVQKDKAYMIEYTWEGVFCSLRKGTFSSYEQEYAAIEEKIKDSVSFIALYSGEPAPEVELFFEKAEP
ncbi:MAG: hypothetical protein NC314_11000 [Roseburia sp.]|nr:hypothetical protein [Roseburia sp.]MCM1243360.1 hypothetical protein [Roseburia sp.]